jgi:hypothetical protein
MQALLPVESARWDVGRVREAQAFGRVDPEGSLTNPALATGEADMTGLPAP